MDSSSKYFTALLLISMLFISTVTPILGCGTCGKPPKKHKPGGKHPKGPPIVKPPVTLPPIVKPPVILPPIVKPPVILPPIVKPPITLPPVILPPIKPPVTLPPVILPPIKPPVTLPPVPLLPPVIGPPVTNPPIVKPCPPPPPADTCPIDTLKLGACVDLLGGLVHIGLGDPVANECCPVLAGLVELEAAVCLCTTLKLKVLNLNIFLPLALQLLITCGKTPPPGFTCSL
ncbi:hypothetical protein RHGRI_000527 [Rhododendron griersonianum]|uniref:Bifunctional inhibitor/plant lipid transfer protein/seed storage helical domain-containing protein n=1 Tax=Rhododendron griersonianum TaxID=479676 RepID=A0AAV6LGX4_9ERIC|nr:hypothetical protein RHGRI_000527 [Rhododendron griersonianum]